MLGTCPPSLAILTTWACDPISTKTQWFFPHKRIDHQLHLNDESLKTSQNGRAQENKVFQAIFRFISKLWCRYNLHHCIGWYPFLSNFQFLGSLKYVVLVTINCMVGHSALDNILFLMPPHNFLPNIFPFLLPISTIFIVLWQKHLKMKSGQLDTGGTLRTRVAIAW